jgi:hypothetical protein
MEKSFRTIVFIVPPALSAAGHASEMAADFLSKVEWLARDAESACAQVRKRIFQAVRSSIRSGRRQVAVLINVFREDCFVHISHQGSDAKRAVIHLSRDFTKQRHERFGPNLKVLVV